MTEILATLDAAIHNAGPWRGFSIGRWCDEADVRDVIQSNYAPYDGDESFLAAPTARTLELRGQLDALRRRESESGGVLDVAADRPSSLLAWGAGYLDRSREIIVGLQTDEPLKRAIHPRGGIRMVRQACDAYGHPLSSEVEHEYTHEHTTHNDAVFAAYTPEMRSARRCGIITGLPDAYGRGRIIGDYRRVALYGVGRLIAWKRRDLAALATRPAAEDTDRRRHELAQEIQSLHDLQAMAARYGYDISRPAADARQAVQWVYFAYLGAIKEQNGAAMSLGRVSTFLDIYLQRDLEDGALDEPAAQELIDDFVLKLRMARMLRTPEYDELFAGDPMWITEAIGGVGLDGRPLVTRTSFRFLHTLYTLSPAPEPNLTVLWSRELPPAFRRYCTQVSLDTDSIQYESDDLMRERYGDDYGIACCVSAMRIGRQMQFFGARMNLPKALLLALNGGRDEISGEPVAPETEPVGDGALDYDDVRSRLDAVLQWLAELYVETMNVIHDAHDRCSYEALQMALHDTDVERSMAFGIAGLSVLADSLSAIRHARVTPVRDARGLISDFRIEGDYPAFGNDDDRVDALAVELVRDFHSALARHRTYRNAEHTLSVLTITSNVVYGQKTGGTPDGRKHGEPFAPGANPMHHRERSGALASLNSVAKLPYDSCRDGISCTFTVTPATLGRTVSQRCNVLQCILNGYFAQGGQHLNVNVLDRAKLVDAMHHPQRYPNLTLRVSGYAVNFHSLSREQQEEVVARTFHDRL